MAEWANHLFTTEYQIEELEEYVGQVANKYRLDKEFIAKTLVFLRSEIEIIPKEEYFGFIDKVKNEISDEDDLPLLALATAKRIDIWSNDPHFKEQNKIRVYTTSELIEMLENR